MCNINSPSRSRAGGTEEAGQPRGGVSELGEQEADDDEDDRRRRGHDAVTPEDRPADEPLERVARRGLRNLTRIVSAPAPARQTRRILTCASVSAGGDAMSSTFDTTNTGLEQNVSEPSRGCRGHGARSLFENLMPVEVRAEGDAGQEQQRRDQHAREYRDPYCFRLAGEDLL